MNRLPRLWLCADVALAPPEEVVAHVRAALTAGAALVWLRSPPGFSAASLYDVAVALRRLTHERASMLLVGDRLDIARASGADGVHLTERSVVPMDARRFMGNAAIVSCAVHDAAGVARCADADALVLSPFGPTPGKGPALGVGGFARLRALAPAAFAVALGGITDAAHASVALAAGADAIAVRRVLADPDPAARCAELLRALS